MKVLILKPQYKSKIWGSAYFKKKLDTALEDKIGEMWTASAHQSGDLKIGNGALAGQTLSAVYRNYPKLFNYPALSDFPVLVKIIATAADLSIQVHPDDCYAEKHENDSGKTEGWLILDAAPAARIVYGHRAANKAEFTALLTAGCYERLLNYQPVKPGEFYPIFAGTVHTIGKNIVLLEIQQSSDVTYRLYDYDRLDLNGRKRPLHIDKALDVIKYQPVAPVRNLFSVSGRETVIWDNPYFKAILLNVADKYRFPTFPFYAIATVVAGTFVVENEKVTFGNSFVVTALSFPLTITGSGRIVLTVPQKP